MKRLLRYRGSEPITVYDRDGTEVTVQPGETVELDPNLARTLLRQPGAYEDDGTHPWVPEPRATDTP